MVGVIGSSLRLRYRIRRHSFGLWLLWSRHRPCLSWSPHLFWQDLGFWFDGTPARARASFPDAQDRASATYAQYGARASYAEDRTDAADAQDRARTPNTGDADETQEAAMAKSAKDALRALVAEPSRNIAAMRGALPRARLLQACSCVLAYC